MKKSILLVLAVTMVSISVAHAKRIAPKKVPPVSKDRIEYRAPRGQMGCVEAWKGKTLLWRRQIYVVKYTVGLERDVQDVFIKTMELKGNALLVKNERRSEYELDLASLEVRVVKGALVEGRK